MTIADFDHLDDDKKKQLLQMCCGSTAWVKKMTGIFPVDNLADLLEYAEEEWYECNPADWLEAFKNHVRIGDIAAVRNNTSSNATWVQQEQACVLASPADQLDELARANGMYEDNFGYHFIVAASGKSAAEMIGILFTRLDNDPQDELLIAAGEQNQITQLRLQQLFS